MNKKIIIGCIVAVALIGIIVLAICIGGKKEDTTPQNNSTETEKTEVQEKVAFTKEVVKTRVKYKAPEDIDSLGSFKDLGHTCTITHYTNQSSVYALYPFDDVVEKVDKVTINGVEYETYKYVEKAMIHYVYRTKVGNYYHLFQYDVYSTEYDDSQVETFMNTVEFINE